MDRIPVRCVGNDSKRYDGKVWLELVEDIVELNGEQLSKPIHPSALKDGDAVKVRQPAKGGHHLKLWSGIVSLARSPPGELRCPTPKKLTSPMKLHSPTKLSTPRKLASTPQKRKQSPGGSAKTPKKHKQSVDPKKPKLKRIGKIQASAKGSNELAMAMDSPLSTLVSSGGVPPGPAFQFPISYSAAASGGVPPGPAFRIPMSVSGGVPPGSHVYLPLPIGAVPPDLPYGTIHELIPSAPSPSGCIPTLVKNDAIVLQEMRDTISRHGVKIANLDTNFGVRLDDLETNFGVRLDNLEANVTRLNLRILEINSQLAQLPDKISLAVERSFGAYLVRQQVHMQRKQDQLASKQDLMHTTMIGEGYYNIPLPIITSPPPSVRLSVSSPQDSFHSPPPPSVVREIPSPPKQEEIDDIISYLSGENQEQSQSHMLSPSSVVTVKHDGRLTPSTSVLVEEQHDPEHFADWISLFQAKEQSAGPGRPANLTSSLSVASGGPAPSASVASGGPAPSASVASGGPAPSASVVSGGPAPSAPFADLISSFMATEQSAGLIKLASSFPAAVRSSGAALSAPQTGSLLATEPRPGRPANLTSSLSVASDGPSPSASVASGGPAPSASVASGGPAPSASVASGGPAPSAPFADLISSFMATEQSAGLRVPIKLASSYPAAVRSSGAALSAPQTGSLLATEPSCGPGLLARSFPAAVRSGGPAPSALSADLTSSLLATEQSCVPRLPVNLASSFPAAVRNGGPAPSAPSADLTSSVLATAQSFLLPEEQSTPSASWEQPEQEHFSSSATTGLKSPDKVMEENKDLWKPKAVGKLAICLARESYFGESVLIASTVTGKDDRPALDDAKLKSLYANIHEKVFKSTSLTYFTKQIVPIINKAIAGLCKRLRSAL